jgi:hypothetical protein
MPRCGTNRIRLPRVGVSTAAACRGQPSDQAGSQLPRSLDEPRVDVCPEIYRQGRGGRQGGVRASRPTTRPQRIERRLVRPGVQPPEHDGPAHERGAANAHERGRRAAPKTLSDLGVLRALGGENPGHGLGFAKGAQPPPKKSKGQPSRRRTALAQLQVSAPS